MARARQPLEAMTVALIVAAGSGERLAAGVPKAYVELAGRPLLQWSVDALTATRGIEQIVVALPPGGAGAGGNGRGRGRLVPLGVGAACAGGRSAGRDTCSSTTPRGRC